MNYGKEYIFKRLRMYDWLTMRGWRPVRRVTDIRNANYVNWVYKTSPEFNADVDLYSEPLKKLEQCELNGGMKK